MGLTIKDKIRFGTFFLFLLLVLSSGLSIFYFNRLRNETENILKANYESLEYCHTMLRALDQPGDSTRQLFEKNLAAQEANITEPGEATPTRLLRDAYNGFNKGDSSHLPVIKQQIQSILALNMQAIERKNTQAAHSSSSAAQLLIVIAVIIFLVSFTFSINFPAIVVNPIRKFTEAIRAISEKNYRHRIHIDSTDEFGRMATAFNNMSERLEEFENSNLNKILFEKTRAEAVINSLKDASIGIDKQDKVLFANQQALQLLGLKATEIVGMFAKTVAEQNDLFRYLISEENNTPFKIVVDGRENYYVRETIEVNQGDSSSKVIILKNITSFKELDVAKTNFIATISHELKTPLASSDFSLKLLEDSRIGALSAEQQELIHQLKEDNRRMLKILSELLNMSQVEAGRIQLNMQLSDPYEVIETSLRTIEYSAREKHIQLIRNIQPGISPIQADADKLIWVLNNFLTNAIKYSPEGSAITIALHRQQKEVSFIITDQGMGIAPAYLDRIFERYFQVPGRSDKKSSGIGLAICKEFIEAMGGKIWVNSTIDKGSTFGCTLPV